MLSLEEEGRFSSFQQNSDISIKTTLLGLILGGSESNASTLLWATSLLLNHPHASKKAREEIDEQVGLNRVVDDSDIQRLVYLQSVVKETLRLYPAGPLLAPRVAGYRVPTGTRVIVNVCKIQRDPRVWENPSAFEPERFLNRNASIDARSQQFELVPFGFGWRSCPGMSLALQVLHLSLARLIQAFEFATAMDAPVDMTECPGLNLPKATPHAVLLTPRLPAELYG